MSQARDSPDKFHVWSYVPIMFSVDWIWTSFYLFVDWSKHYSTFCWIFIHDFRFSLIRFKRFPEMQSPILGLPPINLTSLSHIWRTLTETKWLATFIFILFISKYVSSHNHLCAVDWKSNGHLPIFGGVGKEKENFQKFCVMLFVSRRPIKNFLGHPGNVANQLVQETSVSLLLTNVRHRKT